MNFELFVKSLIILDRFDLIVLELSQVFLIKKIYLYYKNYYDICYMCVFV